MKRIKQPCERPRKKVRDRGHLKLPSTKRLTLNLECCLR